MGKSVVEIDTEFNKQYKGLLDIQQTIYNELQTYPFDLEKDEITEAVINRMDAFWHFHWNNKELLGRKRNIIAAEFFTETCLLFFRAYYHKKNDLTVSSEKNIIQEKKGIYPDISIWRGEDLLAVIELKISDGYNRDMMNHLIERKRKIVEVKKELKFFGVISFWRFSNDSPFGIPIIALKDHINKEVENKTYNHPRTGEKVENLMKQINTVIF